MIGIYKITNKLNGKSYIGQSIHCGKRFDEHYKGKQLIDEVIQIEGIENFSFEVLKLAKKEELSYWEDYYIKEYNTMFPNGYNKKWNCKNTPEFIFMQKILPHDSNNFKDKNKDKDYLLEIYNKEEWLRINLDNWIDEWLSLNPQFDICNNQTFKNKYFLFKETKLSIEIIPQKVKECKWLLEHINLSDKLTDIYNKNNYTSNQRNLYTQIKRITNNRETYPEQQWLQDIKYFQYKVFKGIVELDFEINYRETFIELIKKLKKNYEEEILSHFYLKELSTNKTFKHTPLIKTDLEKSKLFCSSIVVV